MIIPLVNTSTLFLKIMKSQWKSCQHRSDVELMQNNYVNIILKR